MYSEIHARCFALVNSSDLQDKLAGVTAIDKIVDVLGNDMSRALRLAASVQRAFPCPDPLVMTLAAKVFGELPLLCSCRGLVCCRWLTSEVRSLARLAAQGGSLMSGHVDVQVKSCIEWLQGECTEARRLKPTLISLTPLTLGERIEPRRYAAVLVLRELTRSAPALIYEHVPELLDNLWTALRDPKVSCPSAGVSSVLNFLLILVLAGRYSRSCRRCTGRLSVDCCAEGSSVSQRGHQHGL